MLAGIGTTLLRPTSPDCRSARFALTGSLAFMGFTSGCWLYPALSTWRSALRAAPRQFRMTTPSQCRQAASPVNGLIGRFDAR